MSVSLCPGVLVCTRVVSTCILVIVCVWSPGECLRVCFCSVCVRAKGHALTNVPWPYMSRPLFKVRYQTIQSFVFLHATWCAVCGRASVKCSQQKVRTYTTHSIGVNSVSVLSRDESGIFVVQKSSMLPQWRTAFVKTFLGARQLNQQT